MTSPYAPSLASSSLIGRGAHDRTRALRPEIDVSFVSAPGDETQSLLDDLLITYSLLETERYDALTLEQVGELRRMQGQLDERLVEIKERIALEKKMRHAAQSVQTSMIHASPQPVRSTSHMAEALQRTDDVMLQYIQLSNARHDIQQKLLAHHVAVLRDHMPGRTSPLRASQSTDALSLARLSPMPSAALKTPQTPAMAPMWTAERAVPRSVSGRTMWAPNGTDDADEAGDVSRLLQEVDHLQERHRGLTAQLASNSERQATLRQRLSRLCEDNRDMAERLAHHDLNASEAAGPLASIPRGEHARIVEALTEKHTRASSELQAAQAQCAEQAEALERLRAEHAEALEQVRLKHAQSADELRAEYAATLEQLRSDHARGVEQLRTLESEHAELRAAHEALQQQAALQEQAFEAKQRQALEASETSHREALAALEASHREALASLETEHASLRVREAELNEQLMRTRHNSEAELVQQREAHQKELHAQSEAHQAALAEARAMELPPAMLPTSPGMEPEASDKHAETPTSTEAPPTRSPLLTAHWSRRPTGQESSPREGPPGTLSQRLQRMFSGDKLPDAPDEAPLPQADTDLAAELQQLREKLDAERQQKEMVAHRLEEVMVLYRSAVHQPAASDAQAVPLVQEPEPTKRGMDASMPEASKESSASESLSPDTEPVPHTPLGPPTPPAVPTTPHRMERPDLYVDVTETPTHTHMDRALGGSRHRYLEMEVDRLRRAAEQARGAYEQLRTRSAAEREASERERQLVDTWKLEWRALCTRLEQQHHFCMRVLGKADGREEMDGLLDQIKASTASRRAEPEEHAGEDAARLLSQVEEHIGDMAEGLARAGASGLGGNVIAQLEDRIEELETQLAQREASSGADAASAGASLADTPLDVCLYALMLMSALLPEGDALLHSMSLPLDAVHQLFAAPAREAEEADPLEALRRVPALDAACALAQASDAAAHRATGHTFAARVAQTVHMVASDAHRQVPLLVTDVMTRLASTLDTSEMVTDRALVLEEAVRRATFASNPPTPQPDALEVPPM